MLTGLTHDPRLSKGIELDELGCQAHEMSWGVLALMNLCECP